MSKIVRNQDVTEVITTEHGTKYVIIGTINTPKNKSLQVYPHTDWHDFYVNIALPILEGLEFCHRFTETFIRQTFLLTIKVMSSLLTLTFPRKLTMTIIVILPWSLC